MGEVIQMFKRDPVPEQEMDSDALHDLLTKELQDSIADVQASFDTLWASHTPEEFVAELNRIKAEVATWPSRA